jgi:hypothetical protein
MGEAQDPPERTADAVRPTWDQLVAEARRELQEKTQRAIEEETADRWAARAVAAFENYAAARDAHRDQEALLWLIEAVGYEHEAGEHAAGAGTLAEVCATIQETKRRVALPS